MFVRTLAGALAGAGFATAAAAGPVYFATSGNTMFRVSDAGLETFTLGTELNALAFDNAGRLWATESSDKDNDGKFRVFEVANAFSDGLRLTTHGDFLPGRTGTISFMNGSLFGFETQRSRLLEIDPFERTWKVAADMSGAALMPSSSAYDAATDTYYGIRASTLVSVSMEPGHRQSTLASLDFGGAKGPDGGEWYNGVYYHAINDGSNIRIFTVDVGTGATTEVLAFGVDGKGSMGFALADNPIVPAPAGIAALGLGGLALARRRR